MKYLALFLLFPSFLFSQKEDSLSKIQFAVGAELNLCLYCPNSDFTNNWELFNPEMKVPTTSDTAYESHANSQAFLQTRLNIGFNWEKKLRNPKWVFSPRVSYSLGDGVAAQQSWQNVTLTNTDTLTSNQSSYPIYLRQFEREYVYYEYYSRVHYLFLGALLEHQFSSRFSLYSGLELGLGLSTKNRLSSYYSKYEQGYEIQHYENSDHSSIYYKDIEVERVYQTYSAKQYVSSCASFPIGVKLRLSKKDNFLQKVLLSYEFRWQRNTYYLKELYPVVRENTSHLFRVIYELK